MSLQTATRARLLACAAACASIAFTSCGQGGLPRLAQSQPTAVVALDDAFALARPGLAHELQEGRALRGGLLGLFTAPISAPISLSEGAGKALDAAQAVSKREKVGVVLVSSPLIAKSILEGGIWSGEPPLIVPEYRGMVDSSLPRGLWTVNTDPKPAYRAAGAASGAYIAALAAHGDGSPSCGILYSEALSRPREALSAFAGAYDEASRGAPLIVRELTIEQGQQQDQGDASSAAAAQSALADLMKSDIRVLFIAAGAQATAIVKEAERPGLAIGLDFPLSEAPGFLAFLIIPDDKGLAEAAAEARASIGASREGEAGRERLVPALLEPGRAAAELRFGGSDFASSLRNSYKAALRAKGPTVNH